MVRGCGSDLLAGKTTALLTLGDIREHHCQRAWGQFADSIGNKNFYRNLSLPMKPEMKNPRRLR